MKRTMSPARPDAGNGSTAPQTQTQQRVDALSRIKLAFLDEYTCEKRGYDPYDTCRQRATPDIWVTKRKRA